VPIMRESHTSVSSPGSSWVKLDLVRGLLLLVTLLPAESLVVLPPRLPATISGRQSSAS